MTTKKENKIKAIKALTAAASNPFTSDSNSIPTTSG